MEVGRGKAAKRRHGLVQIFAAIATIFYCSPAAAQSASSFAGAQYFDHIKLSPDGNHYTKVGWNHDGTSEATIYDRRTMRRVGGLGIPSGMDFTWVEWSSNDTILASVTTRFAIEGRKLHLPTSRVFSYDIEERREPIMLFEDEARLLKTNVSLNRVVDILPDDRDNIIMGAWRNGDFDLYRVNIETGAADRIAKGRGGTFAWFTNGDGKPNLRMDCATNTCRSVKLYTPEEGSDPSDEKTDWKHLQTFQQSKSEDEAFLEIQPISATENTDEFYVLDGRDELPRRAIRTFNVRTNSFSDTIYADDTHDVSGAIVDRKTRTYIGAQVWRDGLHYEFADAGFQSHMDQLRAYFGKGWNISILDIADDRSAALVVASASEEPGGYYVFDPARNDVRLIAKQNRDLHNMLDSTTSVETVTARDGTPLTTYLTVPGKDANGKLVLMVHGGPEQRDMLDYDRDVQFLASRGYTVARVNFRGSSGYGRDFAQAGYRQWGGVMHRDVVDTTQWLQQQKGFDASETCIMGYSYGAYASLLAGAMQPGLYSCIIAGGGPSDLNQFLKDERKAHGGSSWQVAYWEKAIGDRKADKKKLAAISPIELVDRYDDPIFLFHATYDSTVEIDHSEDLVKALEKAGKPVEFLELYGAHTHNTWSRKSRIKYLEGLETFLDGVFPSADEADVQQALP